MSCEMSFGQDTPNWVIKSWNWSCIEIRVAGDGEEMRRADHSAAHPKVTRSLFAHQEEDESENAHRFRQSHKDDAHRQHAAEGSGITSHGFRGATSNESDADGCAPTGETEGEITAQG